MNARAGSGPHSCRTPSQSRRAARTDSNRQQQEAERAFVQSLPVLCSVAPDEYYGRLHALRRPMSDAINRHVRGAFYVKAACTSACDEIIHDQIETPHMGSVVSRLDDQSFTFDNRFEERTAAVAADDHIQIREASGQ